MSVENVVDQSRLESVSSNSVALMILEPNITATELYQITKRYCERDGLSVRDVIAALFSTVNTFFGRVEDWDAFLLGFTFLMEPGFREQLVFDVQFVKDNNLNAFCDRFGNDDTRVLPRIVLIAAIFSAYDLVSYPEE